MALLQRPAIGDWPPAGLSSFPLNLAFPPPGGWVGLFHSVVVLGV